jgi:dihydroorotase-like cyclic amidohydrolase
MLEGFEILAGHGLRCVVHAENPSIMARRQARMEEAGRTDAHAHLAARPEVCEVEANGRAIVFAEWTGARLHIAHHSSKDALYLVRAAKARGVDVTVETCPQYLLLDTQDVEPLGSILPGEPADSPTGTRRHAVGGSAQRHNRHDRDGSRAACTRRGTAQQHLDLRLRLPRC